MKRVLRGVILSVIGLIGLCLLGTVILALSNRNLPTHSQITDHLSDESKTHLAEVIQLQQSVGDEVWPGWGEVDVPIIVYNEAYAFLVGYADPPDGWVRMPQERERGGPWEIVPDDDFFSEPYYRQPLPDPEITPENFTVKVGEQWVATMWTREYAEIAFYRDFQDSLPPFLTAVFPYRIMWNLIMGEMDTYIAALEHESFHVFQGTVAPARLAEAEFANQYDSQYPWDNEASEAAWQAEVDLLQAAVRAETDEEAAQLAQEFLAQRDERRAAIELNDNLILFEQEREWLEGLAKYVEVTIGQVAAASPDYIPIPELATDEDFHAYTTREQYWSQQVGEIGRLSGREGSTRFYYTGMAQAILLDRLLPDWKERAFDPDVMLEDLLREAVWPESIEASASVITVDVPTQTPTAQPTNTSIPMPTPTTLSASTQTENPTEPFRPPPSTPQDHFFNWTEELSVGAYVNDFVVVAGQVLLLLNGKVYRSSEVNLEHLQHVVSVPWIDSKAYYSLLFTHDTTLYAVKATATNQHEIDVVNFQNPASPVPIETLKVAMPLPYAAEITPDTYYAMYIGSVQIGQITATGDINPIAVIEVPTNINSNLHIEGLHLFVVGVDGVIVFDISDPHSLTQVAFYPQFQIAMSDHAGVVFYLAWVICDAHENDEGEIVGGCGMGIEIVDFTDVLNPTHSGVWHPELHTNEEFKHHIEYIEDMAIYDNTLYLLTGLGLYLTPVPEQ